MPDGAAEAAVAAAALLSPELGVGVGVVDPIISASQLELVVVAVDLLRATVTLELPPAVVVPAPVVFGRSVVFFFVPGKVRRTMSGRSLNCCRLGERGVILVILAFVV